MAIIHWPAAKGYDENENSLARAAVVSAVGVIAVKESRPYMMVSQRWKTKDDSLTIARMRY